MFIMVINSYIIYSYLCCSLSWNVGEMVAVTTIVLMGLLGRCTFCGLYSNTKFDVDTATSP